MGPGETVRLFLATVDRRTGALDSLLERLRPRLVLWSASRLSPALRAKTDPEDVAQDILIRVNRSIQTFDGRDFPAFRRWLFTLGENAIRDIAKYHGAKKRQLPEPRSMTQTTPSQRAARKEELERMTAALEILRPEDQEGIRLRCLEELAHAEVAERIGRSETATRILYCRALKALRKVARPDEDGGDDASKRESAP